MKLFLDCEFNGWGGQLISMALVSEKNNHFYVELAPPENPDPFVAEHVIPVLCNDPETDLEARQRLHGFLKKFDSVEVYADWPADFVHFFDMLHGRDYTETMNRATWLKVPITCHLFETGVDLSSKHPHNALYDAIALRNWFVANKRIAA